MKVEGETDKAALQLNTEDKNHIYKITTVHNFNVENEEIEFVKDFVCLVSVMDPNAYCSQEIRRRLRLGSIAVKELE